MMHVWLFCIICRLVLRPDHISPMDDLAFDMYLDPDVAQVIRKLERKKQDAVAREYIDSFNVNFSKLCFSMCSRVHIH